MADFILVLVLIAVLGTSISYIVREKKRGVKCIGCPVEGGCPHKKNHTACGSAEGQCSCHTKSE